MFRAPTPQRVTMLAVPVFSLHTQGIAVTGAVVVTRAQGAHGPALPHHLVVEVRAGNERLSKEVHVNQVISSIVRPLHRIECLRTVGQHPGICVRVSSFACRPIYPVLGELVADEHPICPVLLHCYVSLMQLRMMCVLAHRQFPALRLMNAWR